MSRDVTYLHKSNKITQKLETGLGLPPKDLKTDLGYVHNRITDKDGSDCSVDLPVNVDDAG